MKDSNKDGFLFDTDDSDQQILPFDFPEEDSEEATAEMSEKDSKETPEEVSEKDSLLSSGNDKKIKKDDKVNKNVSEKVEFNKKPEVEKVSVSERPAISSGNISDIPPGQILQEARVIKDFSTDQVSQNTKIKKKFIEALEKGNNSELPAPVYVEAYIRTLSTLYGIDPKPIISGIIKGGQNKVVPGELLHQIEEGKQVNMEEEAKLKKFLKIALFVIITLGLTGYIFMKISGRMKTSEISENKTQSTDNTPSVTESKVSQVTLPAPKISSEDLEVFLITKPLTMTEMQIPE